jgi:hypothetical protein
MDRAGRARPDVDGDERAEFIGTVSVNALKERFGS